MNQYEYIFLLKKDAFYYLELKFLLIMEFFSPGMNSCCPINFLFFYFLYCFKDTAATLDINPKYKQTKKNNRKCKKKNIYL